MLPIYTLAQPGTRMPRAVLIGLSMLMAAMACGLSVIFFDHIQSARFIFFIAAVVITTWLTGSLGGLLCGVAGLPLARFLLFEPRFTLLPQPDNSIQFFLFLVILILVVAMDARRRQSQTQLKETATWLYTIIDSLSDSLAVMDENKKILIANRKMVSDMGYADLPALLRDQLTTRRSRFSLFTLDDRPLAYDDLPDKTALRENRPIATTVRGQNMQTGEDRWFNIRVSPVPDQHGTPRYILSIVQDITALHRAQETERRAEQQIRDLIDNVGVFVGLISPEGKILEVNRAALQQFGVRREDIIGQQAVDAYSRDDDPGTRETLQAMITQAQQGKTAHQDIRIKAAQDTFIDVEMRIEPVFDDKGAIKYLVPSAMDITQRKRQENELRELNQQLERERSRLKVVVENVPGLIWEGYGEPPDRQTFEPMNDFGEQLVGYPSSAWQETPDLWFRLMHADDIGRIQNTMRETYQAGRSSVLEFRCNHRDGHLLHIEARTRILKDAQGSPIGACGLFMDVTERKNREIELRSLNDLLIKQQTRLKLVLENVPGLIWEMYRESDTVTTEFVSDYANTLLGYPPSAWNGTGSFWRTITHPDDVDGATAKITDIVRNGTPGHYEVRCRHKDGHYVPIEAHVSPFFSPQNIPIGVCGVFMDLTERKKYEAELTATAEALRRSNTELERFAYLASHDLQEPLRMITSYLQLLEQRYWDRLDQDAQEFIGFAVDAATRMKMLISDLLIYSRVQRAERVFRPVNMEQILSLSLHNLQLTIEDTHAQITHDPLPEVQGNETLLTQVFQNLIGNALKFRRGDPPQIHVGVQRQDSQWLFSVADNGIGIANQYLERIFVIFQRLHPNSKYVGTGVGLAICKQAIEKHEGKIWAESTPDEGSTFYFTLPVRENAS